MKNLHSFSILRNLLLCLVLLIPTYIIYSLEDDIDIDSYKLPTSAVPISSLQITDDHYVLQDKPFSGITYDKYTNDKLKKVIYIRDGMRNGPTYAWYSQGQKMMFADYKNGRLDGQFYGWYAYGAVMYNLIYKEGRLDSDSAFLENDDRAQQTTDTKQEGEGDATQKEGD
jgi:antitoxin component YwqK of YwqJK toxin-antitoxin module